MLEERSDGRAQTSNSTCHRRWVSTGTENILFTVVDPTDYTHEDLVNDNEPQVKETDLPPKWAGALSVDNETQRR